MQTVTLREELHQYIDQADDVLVPSFHQDIILERLKKHQANPKEVLTWQQVRDYIPQR